MLSVFNQQPARLLPWYSKAGERWNASIIVHNS